MNTKEETNRGGLDMTRGEPARLLVIFALPLLLGSVFQMMYSVVDTIVLGRFVGTDALAAVGATSSTTGLIMMLGYAMDNGLSIMISQAYGARDNEQVRHLAGQGVYICVISSIVIGLLSVFIARPIMRLLQTPQGIIDGSVLYISITCGIYIANMAYNTAAAILRSIGDSRTPLCLLIFCSVLNVALDLLFVKIFSDGVAAVAFATVLSQAVSAILCWIYMLKKYQLLRFSMQDMKPDRKALKRFFGFSMPMAFEHIVLCFGEMVITAVINGCGANAIAAFTVGGRVHGIMTIVIGQIDSAFAVYSGQNYGAKDYDRIELGMKRALLLLGGSTIISTVLLYLFAGPMVLIFVNAAETEVVELACKMLYIEAAFLFALAFVLLYNAALRGIGAVVPVLISALTELVCKIGLSLLLSRLYGTAGIWFANPVGWLVGMFVSAGFYYGMHWKEKAIARDRSPAVS